MTDSGKIPVIGVPGRGLLSICPAEHWEYALVSGNGTIGALVYGRPVKETIVLNHAGLFMPMRPPEFPPDMGSRVAKLRQLIADAKYAEAAAVQAEIGHEAGIGGEQLPYLDGTATHANYVIATKSLTLDIAKGGRKWLTRTDIQTPPPPKP